MNKASDDSRSKPARSNLRDSDGGGRGSQRMSGHLNSPGHGGAHERIPAKGNDLTHEEDQLQNDIRDDIDDTLDDSER